MLVYKYKVVYILDIKMVVFCEEKRVKIDQIVQLMSNNKFLDVFTIFEVRHFVRLAFTI